MYNKHLSGIIEIRIIENNQYAVIPFLYPYQKDGKETNLNTIIKLLEDQEIKCGFDEDIIEFYLKFAKDRLLVLENVYIAVGQPAARKALELPKLEKEIIIDLFDEAKWNLINFYHKNIHQDLTTFIPFEVNYFHKGDKIATTERTPEEIVGKNILGTTIRPSRTSTFSYKAGEGVYYDEASKSYFAGLSGYFSINEKRLTIKSPYFMDSERMKLFYMNFQQASIKSLKKKEFDSYCQINSIATNLNLEVEYEKYPKDVFVLLTEGKYPTKGTDASIKYDFEIKDSIGTMLEDGSMDFKEKDIYINVEEDQLLAVKTLPKKGSDGINIFGVPVPAKSPRDAVLNHGSGTKIIKTSDELQILSDIHGILNFRNEVISVFPTVIIQGDVNYESGNIRSKANVQISGSVLAGFEVHSDQNITINGTVEDNTVISAKGNILIKGGIVGSNASIASGGNISAKFIEGGKIKCKGNLNVIRFVLESTIECHQSVTILGRGVNLKERGAIVDSKISVKKYLAAPVIGSDAGLNTEIWLAWDESLMAKIKNLKEALEKLLVNISEIREQFEVDITADNIYTLMKSLPAIEKDKIIGAMQQINSIKKKFNMMNLILEKESAKREKQLEEASIEITQKIIPPCVFHCNDVQKTIDKVMPPSRFFFDMDLKVIERSQYLSKK